MDLEIDGSVDRWIARSVNSQIDGLLDGWINRSLDRQIAGSLDRWIARAIDRYIDGSVDRWLARSKDQQIDESLDRWISRSMDRQNMFKPTCGVHSYNVRGASNNIFVARPRTEAAKRAFSYRGVIMWNGLGLGSMDHQINGSVDRWIARLMDCQIDL